MILLVPHLVRLACHSLTLLQCLAQAATNPLETVLTMLSRSLHNYRHRNQEGKTQMEVLHFLTMKKYRMSCIVSEVSVHASLRVNLTH